MKMRNDASFPPGGAFSSSSSFFSSSSLRARSSAKAALVSAKRKKKTKQNPVDAVPTWISFCAPDRSDGNSRYEAFLSDDLHNWRFVCFGALLLLPWRWFPWSWMGWLRCKASFTVAGRRVQIFTQICVNVQEKSWHKLKNPAALKRLHQNVHTLLIWNACKCCMPNPETSVISVPISNLVATQMWPTAASSRTTNPCYPGSSSWDVAPLLLRRHKGKMRRRVRAEMFHSGVHV